MSNSKFSNFTPIVGLAASSLLSLSIAGAAYSDDLRRPWNDGTKALVLDAYEFNPLEWTKIAENRRIAGFIGKASDGLSPKYCPPAKNSLCSEKWRRYSVSKELYHTRKTLAKALGIKWGAYHLGRAGNPIKQAAHFLEFARPQKDEAIVLDIESISPREYINFKDAEIFASFIHRKTGRYPILYTNHATARQIAHERDKYPILSRMRLWYARYKNDISDAFPLGNWKKPDLWQFAYGGNCKTSCPYRVKGTPKNIDVNASMLTVAEMRKAWPFDGLVEERKRPAPKGVDTMLVGSIKPAAKATENKPATFSKSCNRNGFVVGSGGKESC